MKFTTEDTASTEFTREKDPFISRVLGLAIVLELKAVEEVTGIHRAQLLTYMKLAQLARAWGRLATQLVFTRRRKFPVISRRHSGGNGMSAHVPWAEAF